MYLNAEIFLFFTVKTIPVSFYFQTKFTISLFIKNTANILKLFYYYLSADFSRADTLTGPFVSFKLKLKPLPTNQLFYDFGWEPPLLWRELHSLKKKEAHFESLLREW